MKSWASGNEVLKADTWIYVSFGIQGSNRVVFYINDVKVDAKAVQSDWKGVEKKSDFKLGGFVGKLDELMLGTCFRDDSWTRLTYLNQLPESIWPELTVRE